MDERVMVIATNRALRGERVHVMCMDEREAVACCREYADWLGRTSVEVTRSSHEVRFAGGLVRFVSSPHECDGTSPLRVTTDDVLR